MKIKESNNRRFKIGKTSDGVWLFKAMHRPDALGRRGIDYLSERGYEIVFGRDPADVGFSLHGDEVLGIPKEKCILMKGEPPIYNFAFGRSLNTPSYLKKFLGVMSNTITGLDEVHFNSPQDAFQFSPKFFDRKREFLLTMILKYKDRSYKINEVIPTLRKWNKFSLVQYRYRVDEEFCNILGSEFYHSYGLGWHAPCFKGPIPMKAETTELIEGKRVYNCPEPPRYDVLSKYRFNFCPENSQFNGYVTEKPINAMCCGSIPIYLGAPDVYEYLPKGTFIDVREYDSIQEICDYMLFMTEKEQTCYRKRIKQFITSRDADNFSSYIFAQKLTNLIEERL